MKHFFHARDADVVIIAFEVRVSSATETDVPGISHLIRTPSTVVATVAMRISHFRNIGWLAVLACVLDCNSVPFTHQKYRVLLIGKVVTFLSGFGFNTGSTTELIVFFPPEPVIGEVQCRLAFPALRVLLIRDFHVFCRGNLQVDAFELSEKAVDLLKSSRFPIDDGRLDFEF